VSHDPFLWQDSCAGLCYQLGIHQFEWGSMVIGILSISNILFAVLKILDLNSTYTQAGRDFSFFDSPDTLRKFRIFFLLKYL
jgi:hypothetical protein